LRQAAACPLSESWGTAKTLAEALASAPDPTEARLRLRTAIRRITETVTVLVVQSPARPSVRFAAVQMDFQGGGRRAFVILHQAPGNGRLGAWKALSFKEVASPNDLDLRKPDHAQRLEKVLAVVPLDDCMA
jgi:hypothetical protein